MKNSSILVSVTAPVYNEEDVIEKVVRYWFDVLKESGMTHEVVLGDGGSTDRTLEILKGLCKEYPNLKVIHVGKPGGYGNALFSAIYATKGDSVVMLDADGQFDLADSVPMLKKLKDENLDVVTGYRIKKDDTFIRVYADRALNLVVRAMFGLRQKDTNCALKVFKGDIARNMSIEARAWPTPTEIMIRLKAKECKVGEVGIRHYERAGGETKLKVVRTSFEMFAFLIYIRFKLHLCKSRIINKL